MSSWRSFTQTIKQSDNQTMLLCIFNPEHDLCLANGRAHYVPPQSAVDFARQGASLMQILYPEAHCTSVYDSLQFSIPSFQSVELLPWGWNLTLKSQLLRQGVPEHIMPSDSTNKKERYHK